MPGSADSSFTPDAVQEEPEITDEAAVKLRAAGDLDGLWGTAQFGLASVDVLMRIEALPGEHSTAQNSMAYWAPITGHKDDRAVDVSSTCAHALAAT